MASSNAGETQNKKITGQIKISPDIEKDAKKEVTNITNLKKKIENSLGRKTTDLVEIILAGAFYLEGSDIHLEPSEKEAKIRIRIDGVLHDIITFDLETYARIVGRIKLLSKLKLNIANRPQDGRFSILIEDISVEIRTSSLPAEYGESLVLRILNPRWVVSMEELGLREDLLKLFQKEIKKPNGMIICTGPTGSGKTTTLYAFLRKIITPEIKIITIEDPIEYHLKGISQSQVDESHGYNFANGLRAVVRQDPDVILVGEIRDLETTQISLQAALTGHLVLSTVHTNDAAGTVARLQALGEEASSIAPALNVAIGQRLVRRVCSKCVKMKKPSPEHFREIKRTLKNIPHHVELPEITEDTKIPYAEGCKECNFTGYKGRVGIFEAFVVDDEMERFILKSPSIADMREKAVERGMVLMRQDGFIKVLKGHTTIAEVERVTRESEEKEIY
jgi:general secretion pathway protein E